MAFRALELGQPGNPVCPNKPSEEATLVCPGSDRFILQVSTNPVMVQLGMQPQGRQGGPGSVVWQEPKPFLPIVGSFYRRFDAIRVYNYSPGNEAQVLLSVDSQ